MLRDRKQLTAATLSDLGETSESHTEQIGRPMARVTEPVSAGLGRSNLSTVIAVHAVWHALHQPKSQRNRNPWGRGHNRINKKVGEDIV